MDEERKTEIRKRAEAATPGPWIWEGHKYYYKHLDTPNAPNMVLYPDGPEVEGIDVSEADADFIAHARDDIPDLLTALDAAEKAEAELAEAKQVMRFALEGTFWNSRLTEWLEEHKNT